MNIEAIMKRFPKTLDYLHRSELQEQVTRLKAELEEATANMVRQQREIGRLREALQGVVRTLPDLAAYLSADNREELRGQNVDETS